MSRMSMIAEGTIVRGSLEGEGALEVLGRVEGDITMTGDVTIGEAGQVLGSVTGGKVSVYGAVQGDLRARDVVLLEPGARVVGDVAAPRIGIAGGALVRGNVRTESDAGVAAPRRAAVARPATFAAKPVAKVEPKAQTLPLPLPPAPPAGRDDDLADDEEDDGVDEHEAEAEVLAVAAARPAERTPERRPPPPVLPSLGKGAKAKKKKGRD